MGKINKTMSKHTPEPWIFNQEEMKIKGSGDYDGRTVIANVSPKMDYSRGSGTQCANAQRIVECVNALAGVTSEQLAQLSEWVKTEETHFLFDMVSKNRILEAENERLRDALKETINLVENIESTLFHHNHLIEGWHLNGDLEPIMNFVSDFNMEAINKANNALKGEDNG